MDLRALPSLPIWLIPLAWLRIRIIYLWRHGRLPNLSHPRRFTELVQDRKLNDRDQRMPVLADKVAVKPVVAEALGQDWVIPTYWNGSSLPEKPHWPYPFILKASHGCNQNIVCHSAKDWETARRKAQRWIRKPYGLWLDEWAYRDIPRGYIAEPYLGDAASLPIDYKIYVFGGRAAFIQIHVDRAQDHKWILLDTNWRQISRLDITEIPGPPENLERMLRSAEKLAVGFDFVRIDFYEIGGKPLFGEVTFYPGSGLDPFEPDDLDAFLGQQWRAASDRSAHVHTVAA